MEASPERAGVSAAESDLHEDSAPTQVIEFQPRPTSFFARHWLAILGSLGGLLMLWVIGFVIGSIVVAVRTAPPVERIVELPKHPGPGVLTGKLAWRDITPLGGSTDSRGYDYIMAADLDGDGEDELLGRDEGASVGIMHLSGERCGQTAPYSWPPICSWDCDNDGKQEIIRDATEGGLEAVDMQGKAVKKLPYRACAPAFQQSQIKLTADVDGDGTPELLVHTSADEDVGIAAVNTQGKLLFQQPELRPVGHVLLADYDGHGKSVCLMLDQQGQLLALGVDGLRTLGTVGADRSLAACADVNGDRLPDILLDMTSYFDHATGKVVTPSTPSDYQPPYKGDTLFTAFDLNGDGRLDEVYAGPDLAQPSALPGPKDSSRLRIFEPQSGKVLYDEILPRARMLSATVAHSKGRAYLVATEADKVYIYP